MADEVGRHVVMVLAAVGPNEMFHAAHAQKLLFLVSRGAAHLLPVPDLDFRSGDYGPTSEALWEAFGRLRSHGLLHALHDGRLTVRTLSAEGYRQGAGAFGTLPPATADYLRALGTWVQRQSFERLIASVRNAHPDMCDAMVFAA